jgi:hypothetical protein
VRGVAFDYFSVELIAIFKNKRIGKDLAKPNGDQKKDGRTEKFHNREKGSLLVKWGQFLDEKIIFRVIFP